MKEFKPLTPELSEKFHQFVQNGFEGEIPPGLPMVIYHPPSSDAPLRLTIPYWQNVQQTGFATVFDSMNKNVKKFCDKYEEWHLCLRFVFDEETGERSFTHLFAFDFPWWDGELEYRDLYRGWQMMPQLDFGTVVLTVFDLIFRGYMRIYDRPGYFLHGIMNALYGTEMDTLANKAVRAIFPLEESLESLQWVYEDQEAPYS